MLIASLQTLYCSGEQALGCALALKTTATVGWPDGVKDAATENL